MDRQCCTIILLRVRFYTILVPLKKSKTHRLANSIRKIPNSLLFLPIHPPGPFWCSYSYPQFFPYRFVQFVQLSSYSGDWLSLRFVILCFQCGKHPVRCNWFKITAVLYFFSILFYFPLTYISGAPDSLSIRFVLADKFTTK